MSKQLKKVLYIDDENDLLVIVKFSLEQLGGHLVTTCPNGNDGVRLAKEWQPDLILLDVMMPLVDGPTTLKLLRQTRGVENIPVVFMTARTTVTQVGMYQSMGAAGTIPKPFDPMLLASQVEGLWQRSLLAAA